MEASQISAMSAHQIREELKKRGVDATGCREKAEFVDLLSRNWAASGRQPQQSGSSTEGGQRPEPMSSSSFCETCPRGSNGSRRPEQDRSTVLVQMLRSCSEVAQRLAANALATLTAPNDGNRDKVVEAGAIPHLVQLLQSRSAEVQDRATCVLGNIALDVKYKPRIVAAGALPSLVKLLRSTSIDVQDQAASTLGNLALRAPTISLAIAAAGAIPDIIRLLPSASAVVQEMAARALSVLVNEPDNRAEIIAAGGVAPLTRLMLSGSDVLHNLASWTLMQLDVHDVSSGMALVFLSEADATPPPAASRPPIPVGNAPGSPEISAASASATSATPLLASIVASLSIPASAATTSLSASVFQQQPQAPPQPTAQPAEPPAAAPEEKRKKNNDKPCWSCGATCMPLKKCSGCAVASYCGADCQKADWRAHRTQCAGLKASSVTTNADKNK